MKPVDELLKSVPDVDLPPIASAAFGGRGILSFGVVNSENNGKRITLTKSLAGAIGADDSVDILPIPDEGVVLLAKNLPFHQKITMNLRGKDGHKISYVAQVVALLIKCFSLDFKGHVSQTFQDICIDKLPDGSPLAVVNMLNPKPYAGVFDVNLPRIESEAEDEA